MKCWGQYSNGSLGDGTTNDWGDTSGEEPADKSWLDFGSKVVQIVSKPSIAAQASTCVLTETGEIYCWGAGGNGGLGYASTADIGDDELATDLAPVAVWGPAQASPDTVQPSNLKFWVDASDTSTIYASSDCSTTLASDDGEVQCWKDKSGNSYNVSSTTAGNYPLLRLNENHGLPALEFDGTDDHLTGTLTGLSGDQSHTIFVVYDANNKGSNQRPVSLGGSTDSGSETSISLRPDGFVFDHGNNYLHTDTGSGLGLFHKVDVISATYAGGGTSTSNNKLYMNSVELSGVIDGSDAGKSLNLTLTSNITVGARWYGIHVLSGMIYEIIFYDKKLDDADRQAVESYLRAKWQKGVDGISTNDLTAHIDPMKRETIKTDTNATSCDSTTYTTATNGDDISCVLDRSPMSNNIGVAAIANRPILNTTGIESKPAFEYDGTNTYLEGYMGGSPGGDHAFTSSIMAFDTSIDAVAYLYTYGDKDAERSYVGLKTQSGTSAKVRWDGSGPYKEVDSIQYL